MNELSATILALLYSKLPHLKILISQDQWWHDTTLVMKVFEELTLLKLSDIESILGWQLLKTITRPANPRRYGSALVEETATILPGSIIVGDVVICNKCEIGPNCTIFGPSIIGPYSYIGPGAEIRSSLIISGLKLAHRSYLGHSIVGRDVNLGAGFTVAVRNYKRKTVHLRSKDQLIDTKRTMFGAIIADDFYCSINTNVMPGRILTAPIVINNETDYSW